MNSKKRIFFLILFFFCLAFVNFSSAEENTITKLEEAYKNINDAQGRFSQISYLRDLDKTQKFNGRFFIKGDKIRWQYTGDFPQVIYINKKTLTVYDKIRKQAIESTFDEKKYGQLPLALLSRVSVLKDDFEISQISKDTLVLIPKSKMGNIRKIELTLEEGDFPIKSLKVTDVQNNTVKVEFYSVKINKNLRDSIFKFVPQKDDTILRY